MTGNCVAPMTSCSRAAAEPPAALPTDIRTTARADERRRNPEFMSSSLGVIADDSNID
jgi:hypothetical protein